ncbi:cytochrome P450 [Ophiobolus disseminans]|uniref:Cytochrome P450 n=1 Tax=Ophiobolus disseminans TaxID=1469910 RepID=A0A6A6ZGL4_9PLEO|nr:cytochrome P450 [Ophiobolus disseminans]
MALSDFLLGFAGRTWITIIFPAFVFTYWAVWIVYARTLHPLAKVPGPFWPAVSRTWLIYRAYMGDLEIRQRELHAQYGPLLRVAPDEIVCDDPRYIPYVYPLKSPLEKTPWYDAWRPAGMNSRPDMFTNRSERDHAAYQRIVAHIYSLSSVMKSEPGIDQTVQLFIRRLGEFADSDQEFDFGLWLEMFAYDNIGVVFFGHQFGFLQDSVDYGGYIQAVHKSLPFLGILAMSPAYARPFLMLSAITVPSLLKAVIAVSGVKRLAERETYEAQARAEEARAKRVDMTSQLLGIMREKGEKNNFSVREIVSENWTAVMAGSDSTSIGLRSIFYFLMKQPSKLEQVRAEIDAAFADGTLTTPVQYNQSIKLPYLNAVIQESFRLYSPFAASIQRYSPPGGLTLAGTHIPAGMRVGLNPSVVQHHKEVFGEDAKSFRPERWLDSSPEQVKLMGKCMMQFGAGTRRCTGKHIAMAQVHKVTPEIIHRYDFRLTHDGDWKTTNAAFNIQTGVTCKFSRRQIV